MKKMLSILAVLCMVVTSVPSVVQSAEFSVQESTLVAFTKEADADMLAAEIGIAVENQPFVPYDKVFDLGETQGSRNMAVDAAKLKEMLAKRKQAQAEGAGKDEMRSLVRRYSRFAFNLKPDEKFGRQQEALMDMVKEAVYTMIKHNGHENEREIEEKVQTYLLSLARIFIRYFQRDLHICKDLFFIADLDSADDAGEPIVVALRTDRSYVYPARNREDIAPVPQERIETHDYGMLQDFQALLRTNRAKLARHFDEHIKQRFIDTEIALGRGRPSDEKIAVYRDNLIEKLCDKTNLLMVRGKTRLFPGIDNVVVHTSSGREGKPIYDTVGTYRLRIGEKLLRTMITDPQAHDDLLAVAMEATLCFDRAWEDQVRRDEVFWRRITTQYVYKTSIKAPQYGRYNPHKADVIFRKAVDIDPEKMLDLGGMTKAMALLFLRCFEDFDKILRENPDATDDVLIALFWPVIIQWTREFQSLEAFRKDAELDEVTLAHDVYQENVWRFAIDSDAMYVPTMKGDKTSHNVTSSKPEGATEFHQFIRSIYGDRALFETLWKEHFWWRYAQVGVSQAEIDQMFEEQYAAIMDDCYIDIVRGRDVLVKLVSNELDVHAHPRANWSKKRDYDGKKYGVWMAEDYIRLLSISGEAGRKLFAHIILEESQHFSVRGKFKPDSDLKKYEEYETHVIHGKIFGQLLGNSLAVVRALVEIVGDVRVVSKMLRTEGEGRDSLIEFSGAVIEKIVLNEDVLKIAVNEALSVEERLAFVEAKIRSVLQQFSGLDAKTDAQIKTLAGNVYSLIKKYNVEMNMEIKKSHKYEKGYVPYLKSA